MASKGRGKGARHEDMVSEAIMKEKIKSVSVIVCAYLSMSRPYFVCVCVCVRVFPPTHETAGQWAGFVSPSG